MSIIAIDKSNGTCGALVWWELEGGVWLGELEDELSMAGFDASWTPSAPTPTLIAARAAQAAVHTKRQMLRPLNRRGIWDFVEEEVQDDGIDQNLAWTPLVRIEVEDKRPKLTLLQHTDKAAAIKGEIETNIKLYEGLLTPTDISGWLIGCLTEKILAVSLRTHGGFYFIPSDRKEVWDRLKAVVRAVSKHTVNEVPAMTSEEAVTAVLGGVRLEARKQLEELEEYLKGEVSTKGLNAWTRQMEAVQAKVDHYARLLGVELSDLTEKQEALMGMINAARVLHDSASAA